MSVGEGGGSRPIHRFETLFLCFKPMDISAKIRGGGSHPFFRSFETHFNFFFFSLFHNFGTLFFPESPIVFVICFHFQTLPLFGNPPQRNKGSLWTFEHFFMSQSVCIKPRTEKFHRKSTFGNSKSSLTTPIRQQLSQNFPKHTKISQNIKNCPKLYQLSQKNLKKNSKVQRHPKIS